MTNQKIAIATIETEAGTMTIYFNGDNQLITGECGDRIETTEYRAENLSDACDYVYASYSACDWNLVMNDL